MHQRAHLAGTMMIVLALTVCGALAQEAPSGSLSDQWDDFVHYVKLARPELAQSFGQAILDSGASPKDVYRVAAATEGLQALLNRAETLDNLKGVVDELRTVIETGYAQLRADPKEIQLAIDKLDDGARPFAIGSQRLIESGEYAVPLMVRHLMDESTNPRLHERIIEVLPRLGKDAVRPLSVALQTTDAKLQEILAGALGEIGYRHAMPRLRELYEKDGLLPQTKAAVKRALLACGSEEALSKPLAALFYEAAMDYYNQAESVQADPRYGTSNVWAWDASLGLVFTSAPRQIFCDVYAMRMSRLTLQHDAEFFPAVSLWLSAAIRKELDLPAGATDTIRGENQPAAAYYVRAAGAGFAQEVLARALADSHAGLATAAIEALADTAGAKSLVEPISEGEQPLVKALVFPDRTVRYLAAVSLASALPEKSFAGSPLVLSTLNEALRQGGKPTALLSVTAKERRNLLKDALRAAGYEVIEQADADKVVVEAIRAGGVDVVVVADDPSVRSLLPELRHEPVLATTAVLVSTPITKPLRDLAKEDGRVVLMGEAADADALTGALGRAQSLTAGRALDPTQIDDWAVRAAKAVRLLGLTGNDVFDLHRTFAALSGAMMSETPAVRVASAEALAVLESTEAQQAIVALVTDEVAAEATRISAMNALAESVRRFGNKLTDAHAQSILAIVNGDGSQPLREAAAQVLGAMDLPSDQIKSLILKTAGMD
jgi:hypothetical protein